MSFIVTLDHPEKVSHWELRWYVVNAVKLWCGQFAGGDPMRGIGSTIEVKPYKRRRVSRG